MINVEFIPQTKSNGKLLFNILIKNFIEIEYLQKIPFQKCSEFFMNCLFIFVL